MSYILDALKKSQQERELGQVPRLQSIPFDEPSTDRFHPGWMMAAVTLAGIAVAFAIYAALRVAPAGPEAPSEIASQQPLALPDPGLPQASTAPIDVNVTMAEEVPQAPAGTQSSAAADTERADDEDVDAVTPEPQILVVPAPPKPGKSLPRGADELRRAVLGVDDVEVTAAPSPVRTRARPGPESVPVPDDLLADIEAFKQQHGTGDPGALPRPAKAPKDDPDTLAGDRPAAPASASLRRRLPDFAMSVHVYDAEPTRRFVYINGRKVRERQTSREGLRVEQVVADGAVLSWEGERFFERR
jgi:general secretion pathway protein B